MTNENAVVAQDRDAKRKAALLKAIGLDRVPEEQREIALNIANRYELDLMLRHIVLVDGKPYITRDGLLHVAHRSGQLDGIEVTEPDLVDMAGGKHWRVTASVYRKDMTRPFTYVGRYPVAGRNKQYAPEMATKVAEVMALRRAFDVSAPVIEERWENVPTQADDTPRPSLQEQVAARQAEVITSEPGIAPAQPSTGSDTSGIDQAEDLVDGEAEWTPETDPEPVDATARCDAFDESMGGRCNRAPGHKGNHMASEGSWK